MKDYYLCVVCGHEKVLNIDNERHTASQDHQDFNALNWYKHQLSLRGWTVEKLKSVQDRLTAKKKARSRKK